MKACRRGPGACFPGIPLIIGGFLALGAVSELTAQDVGAIGGGLKPGWLQAWSPLLWTAEFPRTLPSGSSSLPEPLAWPSPRVGLFWTAGNPGALPFEVGASFSAFQAEIGGEDGSYRRPLDPAESRQRAAEAIGWRAVGENGAAIGRVRVAGVDLDRALSDFDMAYPGSPYVVMDTAGSDLGRTDASIEGAVGWRAGSLGLGLALGYRAQQTRTEAAPVPRSLSAADPGASLGIAWEVSSSLRIGAHGRWRSHAERTLLYAVAAPSRLYLLQGYFEPPPQNLTSHYSRRMEREGFAFGLSAGGSSMGADWAAFVERGEQEERQHPTGENHPDSDTWNSDAWTVGTALVWPLSFKEGLVSLSGRYSVLSGEAARGDLPDTLTFLSDESVFHGEGELRLRLTRSLGLLGRLTLRHEDRNRRDQLAQVGSDLESWTTGFGIAAVYRPSTGLAVSGALAANVHGAGGTIPDPGEMGPVYGLYVAPELALGASDASGRAASLGFLWSVFRGGAFWASLQYSAVSPRDQVVSLASLPEGDRRAWSARLGIVVRGDGSGS